MRLILLLFLPAAFLATASAADAGPFEDVQASYDRHDYGAALQDWHPLADHCDTKAQNKLGNRFGDGQGVPQDYAEALRWYRKAADQGDAHAQANLGTMYSNGDGVPQDYAEALRWYRKAADQGYAHAQFNLGVTYENGKGVLRDYAQAYLWFNLAAARAQDRDTRVKAAKWRDVVAEYLTSTQIAEAQRIARDWKPTGFTGLASP
jgi:TPR repeat protein